MKEISFNRFTGFKGKTPSGFIIIGQWVFLSNPQIRVLVNAFTKGANTFLVPDESGNWRVTSKGHDYLDGSVARNLLLSETESESLRSIGALLDRASRNSEKRSFG